jgi:DNA-binding IclR family transcriptional regulator
VTSEAGLRAELRKTREQGYGLVDEEADPGISAIAMVVRDASGPGRPVVGCVSIGGPTFRLSHERLAGFLPHLEAAVKRLSDLWPVRSYHTRELCGGKAV